MAAGLYQVDINSGLLQIIMLIAKLNKGNALASELEIIICILSHSFTIFAEVATPYKHVLSVKVMEHLWQYSKNEIAFFNRGNRKLN